MADLDSVLCTGRTTLHTLLLKAQNEACLNDPQEDTRLSENDSDDDVAAMLDQYRDKNGAPTGNFKNTKNNIYKILRRDRRWKNRIWLNSFTNALKLDDRDYRDTDDTRISLWIDRSYDIRYSEQSVGQIVKLIGEENARNPLLEWLESMSWDGTQRIKDWIVHATNCEDTELNRKMGEKWLIQAIARAYSPGCKADCVLILAGRQGAGKSTLLRTLATDAFFSDTPLDIGSANSYSQIQRAWIYEVAELDSVRRSANSATKAFLSAQEDNYRPAYGRHAVTVKRHVVFAGTTNESQFINDMTGSRRYWPVKVDEIDIDWVKENRDQLWAEAIIAFNAGENWYLDQKLDQVRDDASMVYRQEDPWMDPIVTWCMLQHGGISTQMIMEDCLGIEKGRMNRRDEMRVSDILREIGYEKNRVRYGGKRKYVWQKVGTLSLSEQEG